jgi:hypothetical protein
MSFIRLKPLHNGAQRRVLCAVLATMICLCAVMVALPGLYQALFNQSQAASNCHSHLSDNTVGQASGETSVILAATVVDPAGSAGSNHSGSSTVCSGDFVSADGASTPIPLVAVLVSVLCILPLLAFSIPAMAHHFNKIQGLGPPFCGHLRSHLGLRRIHI